MHSNYLRKCTLARARGNGDFLTLASLPHRRRRQLPRLHGVQLCLVAHHHPLGPTAQRVAEIAPTEGRPCPIEVIGAAHHGHMAGHRRVGRRRVRPALSQPMRAHPAFRRTIFPWTPPLRALEGRAANHAVVIVSRHSQPPSALACVPCPALALKQPARLEELEHALSNPVTPPV